MSVSVFDSKLVVPNDQMLAFELGETVKFLDRIRSIIQQDYGNLTNEWKPYGQKSGWVLKLLHKKRNVLFVVPLAGYFRVAFTFGDKATDAILAGDYPDTFKQELFLSRKFAEGRTIQVEVKDESMCGLVLSLIQIKMKY